MYYRQYLVATCVLATAITVRAAGVPFGSPSAQAGPQAPTSKPAASQPATAQTPSTPVQAGGYVGTAKCLECHTDQGDTLKERPMARRRTRGLPRRRKGARAVMVPGKRTSRTRRAGTSRSSPR